MSILGLICRNCNSQIVFRGAVPREFYCINCGEYHCSDNEILAAIKNSKLARDEERIKK